jgi:hypothetical protein
MLGKMSDDTRVLMDALAGDVSRDGGDLLPRWMDLLRSRSWKLRRSGDAATVAHLRERCGHFLESLGEALKIADTLRVGGPAFREAVQSLSFTAGWMAGIGLPVTDAVALVYALEEVLDWRQPRFFHSLMVVVTEAFAASLVQRERAHHRDVMEKSQVVCDLHPRLPGLFLVGDPDRQALEDAAGRVMMLAAMRDARVVLVDGSALLAPETALPVACPMLVEHGQAASVRVVIGGVSPLLARELRSAAGGNLSFFETFAEAMAEAIAASGLAWAEP